MEVTKEEPWSNPLPFTEGIKIRELERAHPHEEGGKGQTWAREASTLSKFQAWGGALRKEANSGDIVRISEQRKTKVRLQPNTLLRPGRGEREMTRSP